MPLASLRRAAGGRPPAARALLLMCLLSAGMAGVGVVAPLTDQSPVRANAVAGVLALLLAALVWTVPSPAVLRLGVVAHVVGIGVLVALAVTPVGAAGVMLGCVWVALYAAFFLGRTAGRVCSGLVAVTLGAAVLADPFLGAGQLWLLVSTTSLLATEVVGGVVTRLARAAVTDPLTGALNRKGLQEAAARELGDGSPLVLAVLDLDGFKQVNDRDGHAAGDALLQELVTGWSRELRDQDVLARQGGDEFVLLLPRTGPEDAAVLLDRLRRRSPAPWSVGTAVARDDDRLDDLLLRADRALYAAKRARALLPQQRTGSSVPVR